MRIGSMKEEFLTSAKDDFLLNCRLAGFDDKTLSTYREVLGSFLQFTGDMVLRQLTPHHVRTYLHTLDDSPDTSKEHIFRLEINHYVVIHTWIRWMHVQRFITEPYDSDSKPLVQRGACCAIERMELVPQIQ